MPWIMLAFACVFRLNSPAHISKPTFVKFANNLSYTNIYFLFLVGFVQDLMVKLGQNRSSTSSPTLNPLLILEGRLRLRWKEKLLDRTSCTKIIQYLTFIY
jgi:hypothetical protein